MSGTARSHQVNQLVQDDVTQYCPEPPGRWGSSQPSGLPDSWDSWGSQNVWGSSGS
ncbi:hypothetical protein MSG_01399 [Mycobacterium shigaense]|uniref:Uncharacterized protein n=1 Tax=Mycobacterium shigaense TaxID=722731 RepID=A0A1Z4EF21_9MYCO|nr:hypothetical protein MSG_01399 [Mycobacterium shigaense]